MAKVKTIPVALTDDQMEQLAPLFDKVDENPGAGFVIAQVYKGKAGGLMMVGFTTPYEVKKGMEKTIAKNILAKKTEDLLSSTAP